MSDRRERRNLMPYRCLEVAILHLAQYGCSLVLSKTGRINKLQRSPRPLLFPNAVSDFYGITITTYIYGSRVWFLHGVKSFSPILASCHHRRANSSIDIERQMQNTSMIDRPIFVACCPLSVEKRRRCEQAHGDHHHHQSPSPINRTKKRQGTPTPPRR